jgi:Lipoprotein LpqB beta-propeller domain/Sporulation and spore germination
MRRSCVAVVLLAALVLGGCGIPDNTAVVPIGPGPSTGTSSGDDITPVRSLRGDTTDKATFVENYLTAAAGDYDSATEQVKQFLSPGAAATFKALTPEIRVVRLVDAPLINPGNPVVTLRVQQVGTLGNFGILDPSEDSAITSYRLTIGPVDGQSGLFVTKAPQVLLLSDTALARFYTRRAIYFWNSDHTGLVPDVRYLSLSVPSEQQPTEVITWLTNGPAPWLAKAVDPLPEGTKLVGNVPAVSSDKLQISLSGQAMPADDPNALDRLQKQLRWSLRPNLPGALELTVEHQVERVYGDAGYLASNAAHRTVSDPERFVVYDGQVRRLGRSHNASEPVPVLTPQANHQVRSAAFGATATRTYAALVVSGAKGRSSLRVGSARPGERAALARISLDTPIGRPVWAVSPPVGTADGTVGLVTAKGKLYSFAPDGSTVRQIAWPGGMSEISGVAVAPDARRLALLSRGQLYVAALSTSDDGLQLSAPTLVRTTMQDLTAVDWSGEGMLVVAGTKPASKRVAIMNVSVDGASQTDRGLSDLGTNPVTYLSAYPADPARNEETATVLAYVLDGSAYDELNAERIGVADLAQPVTNPRPGVLPTAPFFLG